MCTCGHGAASAHDIDNSVSAFTACVVSGCTCKAFTPTPEPADTRCAHLRDGGCCTGPGYCAHLCGEPEPETQPDEAAEQDPEPAVCGARHYDAVGAVLECELTADHVTAHRAHTTPDQYEAWTDDAAEAPVTNPCRAGGRGDDDLGVRAYGEEITAAYQRARRYRAAWDNARKRARMLSAEVTRRAPLTGEYAARAHTAEAAHEEHRQQLVAALGRHDNAPGTVPQTWELLITHTAEAHRWATDAALGRNRAAVEATKRATRAEATIARVRALAARWDCVQDRKTAAADIRTALGDDQPEPEGDTCGGCGHHITWHRDAGARPCHKTGCPCAAFTGDGPKRCCVCGSPDVAYHNFQDDPFCGPCAEGLRPDTEPPTVPVLDALVTDVFAAVRRAWHRTR
jgi:hypothetical protein